jgi:deoxyuridine 5'-triphosphate nucleotidohydrolase
MTSIEGSSVFSEGLSHAVTDVEIISNSREDPNNGWAEFLNVEKMDPQAYIPKKGSAKAAGYDLYAFEDVIIPAWSHVIVPLKIKIRLPNGCYGRIASRSGLSVQHGIEVGAGVIDQDYQGEIKVVLRNFSDYPYNVVRGKACAQLILERIAANIPVKQVSSITDIFGTSERKDNGFGSTG